MGISITIWLPQVWWEVSIMPGVKSLSAIQSYPILFWTTPCTTNIPSVTSISALRHNMSSLSHCVTEINVACFACRIIYIWKVANKGLGTTNLHFFWQPTTSSPVIFVCKKIVHIKQHLHVMKYDFFTFVLVCFDDLIILWCLEFHVCLTLYCITN